MNVSCIAKRGRTKLIGQTLRRSAEPSKRSVLCSFEFIEKRLGNGGKEKQTDVRRGEGVYRKVLSAMEDMKKEKLLFGSSVTVTKENLEEVTSDSFIKNLEERDCKALFFVEFVPMSPELKRLAPEDKEREYLEHRLSEIRNQYPNMIFLSFLGDEKSSGGCIAAGRGFFHINSHGGAEPCPFSPYSDVNVRDTSLREALQSGLFVKLRDSGTLTEDHAGGCVLYENRDKVESYFIPKEK